MDEHRPLFPQVITLGGPGRRQPPHNPQSLIRHVCLTQPPHLHQHALQLLPKGGNRVLLHLSPLLELHAHQSM